MNRRTIETTVLALLLAFSLGAQQAADLTDMSAGGMQPGPIQSAGKVRVTVGAGTVLTLPDVVERFAIGDDKVAAVHVVSDYEVLLQGLNPGQTTVFVWLSNSSRLRYDLLVSPDIDALRAIIHAIDPGISVELTVDGSAVILRGNVPDSGVANRARSSAEGVVGGALRVVSLIDAPGLTVDADARLSAGLASVDPRIRVRRIQVGAEPDNTKDSLILEGRVKTISELIEAVTVTDLQLGGSGGRISAPDDRAMQGDQSSGGAAGVVGLQGGTPPAPGLSAQVSRGLVIKSASGRVLSFLEVDEVPQILVSVRVMEINRSRARRLGIDYRFDKDNVSIGSYHNPSGSAIGARTDPASTTGITGSNIVGAFVDKTTAIAAALDFLQGKDLARSVAEPNIIALSGEEASVLVGGTVPIPIATTNAVASISGFNFQGFGVSLQIRPTLARGGMITLELAPTIARPSSALGVSGVPGFVIQRLTTTARVAPGQSLLLGGLLSFDESLSDSGVPGLSSVPVLRHLFSWEGRTRDERELIFVLTPRILTAEEEGRPAQNIVWRDVKPTPPASTIDLPPLETYEKAQWNDQIAPGNLQEDGLPPAFSPKCQPLSDVSLMAPSNGASGVSSGIPLSWVPVGHALRYDVYVDTSKNPQVLYARDLVTPVLPLPALNPGTTYYWKVVARGDATCEPLRTSESPVWSFKTVAAAVPPTTSEMMAPPPAPEAPVASTSEMMPPAPAAPAATTAEMQPAPVKAEPAPKPAMKAEAPVPAPKPAEPAPMPAPAPEPVKTVEAAVPPTAMPAPAPVAKPAPAPQPTTTTGEMSYEEAAKIAATPTMSYDDAKKVMTGATPAPAPSGKRATRVAAMNSAISGSSLVVTIEADGVLDYRSGISRNPLRLVILLPGVASEISKDISLTDPHVRRARIVATPEGSRVEFDLDQVVEYKITQTPKGLEVRFAASGLMMR